MKPQVAHQPLPRAQAATPQAIESHIERFGESPTRREIAKARGIGEGEATWQALALRSRGLVATTPHKPRSLRIVQATGRAS